MGSSGYKSGKIKAFPKKVSKFFGNSEIIRTFATPEPAKPLNDAQMCGSFYFYTMSNRVPFQKPYTNPHDLVLQLQQRGWLTIVALTRNYCCHHARVWNKQNTIRPMMPNRMTGNWISLQTDPLRVYFDLCIIKYFLDVISPQNDMKAKIDTLLANYPDIDTAAMGFPRGWENEPLWQ